jgi:hypothetical protein
MGATFFAHTEWEAGRGVTGFKAKHEPVIKKSKIIVSKPLITAIYKNKAFFKAFNGVYFRS